MSVAHLKPEGVRLRRRKQNGKTADNAAVPSALEENDIDFMSSSTCGLYGLMLARSDDDEFGFMAGSPDNHLPLVDSIPQCPLSMLTVCIHRDALLAYCAH